MRQYDDPVEVRRGETEDPDQFLWRGRLWKVRAVVAHWVETGPWWQARGRRRGRREPRTITDLVAERELWRVEAGRGIQVGSGRGRATTSASSTSPSTGPTGAGSSSGAWTEAGHD